VFIRHADVAQIVRAGEALAAETHRHRGFPRLTFRSADATLRNGADSGHCGDQWRVHGRWI
jgi:hypothetical protein